MPTIDHNDRQEVAPELVKPYKVFTPDCCGYRKSNNPHMSSSFKELADGAAAFLREMG